MVKKGLKIRGIIFDLDGTLVHTTIDFALMKKGVLSILMEEGVPREVLDPARTTTENQLRGVAFLREQGSEAERALQRTSRLMSEVEMQGVLSTRPVQGTGEALRALREIGLGLGVLTRGSRAYSTLALRAAGLEGAIDHMVCRDDHAEQEAKPAPISLRRAAAGLQLEAGECLMVGDHLMDLECARGAGSGFVGVLSGYGNEDTWRSEGVDYVEGVGELPSLLFRHD